MSARSGKEETVAVAFIVNIFLKDERRDALSLLSSNENLLQSLKSKLSDLQKYHPDRLMALQKEFTEAIDSANRWTGMSVNITPIGFSTSCTRAECSHLPFRLQTRIFASENFVYDKISNQ